MGSSNLVLGVVRDPEIPLVNARFTEIDEETVLRHLTNINVRKATGADGISAKLLRMTAPGIAKKLTKMFNYSLKIGQIPRDWSSSGWSKVNMEWDGERSSAGLHFGSFALYSFYEWSPCHWKLQCEPLCLSTSQAKILRKYRKFLKQSLEQWPTGSNRISWRWMWVNSTDGSKQEMKKVWGWVDSYPARWLNTCKWGESKTFGCGYRQKPQLEKPSV